MSELSETLAFLPSELVSEITENSEQLDIPKGTEILRQGQYIKVIPIVLKGHIKVYSQYDDREILLYYILPNESCIMSFAAGLERKPSEVFAVTEEDTTALLLPVEAVMKWIKAYPGLNSLFFQQYHKRYSDLLNTVNHVLFDRIDKRLYDYLLEKKKLVDTNPIKISHRQIATDLGTAREVISRAVKKLETENKIKQHPSSIEILKW